MWPFRRNRHQYIIDFINAVIESPQLQSWLFGLGSYPKNIRYQQLSIMKLEMEAKNEPIEFINIVGLLNKDLIFHAIVKVVKDVVSDGVSASKSINRNKKTRDSFYTLVALISAEN